MLNRMRLSAMLVLAWAFVQPSLSAADGVPAELGPLQGIFDSHLQTIEMEHRLAMAAWRDSYRTELESLQGRYQQAGDLNGWRAIDEEITRFRARPEIPAESSETLPEVVRSLHAAYRQRISTVEIDRSRRIAQLTDSYFRRLQGLQIERTRAGNMTDALAFNNEIARVRELPVVAAITASMAEREAEAAQGEGGAEVQAGAEEPGRPPGASRLPEGVRIHAGMSAPRIPDLTFRPYSLSITEPLRLARNLTVRAERAQSTEIKRSTSSYYYYSSRTRSGSMHSFLRLGFRSPTVNQSCEGARLLVEFYGRSLGARSSRIVPQSIGTQFFELPTIDSSQWVFVDLPPVSVHSSSYSYSSLSSSSRSGTEYYGSVISVFGANNELLYQAFSAPALASLAPTELPRRLAVQDEVEVARLRMDAARNAREQRRVEWHEALRNTPRGADAAYAAYQESMREYNEAQSEYYRLRQVR